ncbi:MAG: NADH-quinone oxidoreductase subunit J [Chloroflexi bacterium]|nr:NADH-quinone oxidoreductase subunit J [Chloroflexota bacterium]
MTPDLAVFLGLAVVTVATALGMLISRSAVYSALFLVLNFATVAMVYFLLGAPFIALAQVTVYAGAIMVLFLFVIMLLGADRAGAGPVPRAWQWQRIVAIGLGAVLAAETVYLIFSRGGMSSVAHSALAAGQGGPAEIGLALFRDYLLPFEVTSVLLLVAMVGAVVLSREERKR